MKKKFLSTLTALAMVLSMLPVSVFATGTAVAATTDADGSNYYEYESLQDAFDGVSEGGTITLLKDVTITEETL